MSTATKDKTKRKPLPKTKPSKAKIPVYELPNHVTLHDVSKRLGRPRQTILKWLRAHNIPFTIIHQGQRPVATFVAVADVPKLTELNTYLNKNGRNPSVEK